jgi:Domain of unknown function (DUF6894)
MSGTIRSLSRFVAMPRYYFHLNGRRDRLLDETGVVLPDTEAAWYQAVRSAREVLRADLHLGVAFEDQRIEIWDERGSPVDHIPLTDIANYAV